MLIIKNKDGSTRHLYTGKEFMIAIGKKYDMLHDGFKNKYEQYFEFFDGSKDGLDHIPIFESEKEFNTCLEIGKNEIQLSNEINDILDKDENNILDIKDFKISTSDGLRKVLKIYRGRKRSVISIIIFLVVIIGLLFLRYFIQR